VLGDLINMPERLSNKEYATMCRALGEKQEGALDEAYEAAQNFDERLHAHRPPVDRAFTISEKNELQDLMVVLPENPVEDKDIANRDYDEIHLHVNEIVYPLGLYCVKCATEKLNICILIGFTKPNYIEEFVNAWNGSMIRNRTSYFCDPLNFLESDKD
jgi:hypothetical protein